MRTVVCGANGAMGKLICDILGEEVIGKVSIDGENNVPKTFSELGKCDADVVIDFSHHSAVADVLNYAKEIGAAAVIGTTGHTAEEKALIEAAAKEAVSKAALCKVPMPETFHMEIDFIKHHMAYSKSFYPSAVLKDDKIVCFDSDDWFEVLRFCHFVLSDA